MTFEKLYMVMLASLSLLAIKSELFQGGDRLPDLSTLSDADLKTMTIKLERIGCYGTCPAYTVTIHGDGRVEYSGKSHVKESGPREGRVEIEKIRGLVSEFGKMKFWELAEDYSGEKCKGRICTDMATAVTELKIKERTHRVRHYYGCGGAPRSLFDIESAIDKTASAERWTGDVSNAGPYGTTCFGTN